MTCRAPCDRIADGRNSVLPTIYWCMRKRERKEKPGNTHRRSTLTLSSRINETLNMINENNSRAVLIVSAMSKLTSFWWPPFSTQSYQAHSRVFLTIQTVSLISLSQYIQLLAVTFGLLSGQPLPYYIPRYTSHVIMFLSLGA